MKSNNSLKISFLSVIQMSTEISLKEERVEERVREVSQSLSKLARKLSLVTSIRWLTSSMRITN